MAVRTGASCLGVLLGRTERETEPGHRFGARARRKAGKDPLDMATHGVHAYPEARTDLGTAHPHRHQLRDLALPRRQVRGGARCTAATNVHAQPPVADAQHREHWSGRQGYRLSLGQHGARLGITDFHIMPQRAKKCRELQRNRARATGRVVP